MADNELLQSTAVDANNDYNASEIQGPLRDWKPCASARACTSARPTTRGLHHLVYEIVDNSIDEALARLLPRTSPCTINPGQYASPSSITAAAFPSDIQAQTGRPALEVVFTVLHAGGKFGGGGYKVSGGLHGVGASVVNALSEWLTVQVLQATARSTR